MNTVHSLKTIVSHGVALATFLLILYFILLKDMNTGNRLWLLVPFTTVPLAGAIGGVVVYYINPFDRPAGFPKIVFTILSVLLYSSIVLVGFRIGMESWGRF